MAKITVKGGSRERLNVSADLLLKMRDDLVAGRIRVPDSRVRVNDDRQHGLQILIYKHGEISFHAIYNLPNGSRPVVKVAAYDGNDERELNKILSESRQFTSTIRDLGDQGVDVQDGFHQRLIRELREQGTKWRPWPGYKGHN